MNGGNGGGGNGGELRVSLGKFGFHVKKTLQSFL